MVVIGRRRRLQCLNRLTHSFPSVPHNTYTQTDTHTYTGRVGQSELLLQSVFFFFT